MSRVDGIAVGTDVKLAGIKVGEVSALTLDPRDYLVVVHMTIHDDVKVPDDSSLMVTSSGLLGSSYLSISPGGSDKLLAAGGRIRNTQGAVDLMGLLSRFAGSAAEGNSNSGGTKP
jgi:phospholipid/cholesterol/gamma-HCH transport system substrate-binding protein